MGKYDLVYMSATGGKNFRNTGHMFNLKYVNSSQREDHINTILYQL